MTEVWFNPIILQSNDKNQLADALTNIDIYSFDALNFTAADADALPWEREDELHVNTDDYDYYGDPDHKHGGGLERGAPAPHLHPPFVHLNPS